MKNNSFKEELKDLFSVKEIENPAILIFNLILLPFIFIWWLVDKLKSPSVKSEDSFIKERSK